MSASGKKTDHALAATWLVNRTANDYSPAYMIMAAAAITFLVLLCRPARLVS